MLMAAMAHHLKGVCAVQYTYNVIGSHLQQISKDGTGYRLNISLRAQQCGLHLLGGMLVSLQMQGKRLTKMWHGQ